MPHPAHALPLLLPVVGLALLTGCAAPAAGGAERISVVASTSVYGAIAQQIAGEHADVTSIITLANQDPHGYEATARDQLALSKADLVVQNGGGYDPFVGELLETTGTDPVLLTAVEDGEAAAHEDDDAEAGHAHEHGENEHVWYSLHAMEELGGRIGKALEELDPEHADAYATNTAEFTDGIEALEERVDELAASLTGTTAIATEPVPLPLLEGLGIEDHTPVEFLAAIEDERDVPPAVLAETLHLLRSGEVDLVAFNEQTVDATSTRVLEQAESSGVPVVSFSELPPENAGYLQWMDANVAAIEEAAG